MFKKIIILLILFFLFPILGWAETVSDSSADELKQTINTFLTKNNIPTAAVQIYRAGKPQTFYLGDAKPTTQFDVSSLTEILTGLLLAQQVDAAKVQLATSVQRFFPKATNDFSKITLRSLATNTSGLPANATINYVTDAHLNAVDESWQPSTIGMTMLTKALESVAHKNINELYQKQIFSALGMRTVKTNAADLKITATDMQKFLAAAIGLPGTPESVLYPMRLTQTAFVELNDRMIGLGWRINSKDEQKTQTQEVTKDVSVKDIPARPVFKPDREYVKAASRFYLAVLPDKKTGIVIMLSSQVDEEELAQLGEQLLKGIDT